MKSPGKSASQYYSELTVIIFFKKRPEIEKILNQIFLKQILP